MFGQNKKNALLHLIACVLLSILGYINMKLNTGMYIIFFILAGVMLLLALMYFSRKDDF